MLVVVVVVVVYIKSHVCETCAVSTHNLHTASAAANISMY